MTLSKAEIRSIDQSIARFINELGELGVDASVLLYSYQNEDGTFSMNRAGNGNPYAQDGMVSCCADVTLARTIALEADSPLFREDDDEDDDDWKN